MFSYSRFAPRQGAINVYGRFDSSIFCSIVLPLRGTRGTSGVRGRARNEPGPPAGNELNARGEAAAAPFAVL